MFYAVYPCIATEYFFKVKNVRTLVDLFSVREHVFGCILATNLRIKYVQGIYLFKSNWLKREYKVLSTAYYNFDRLRAESEWLTAEWEWMTYEVDI